VLVQPTPERLFLFKIFLMRGYLCMGKNED
jgi:hypothetical protein